MSVAEDIAKIAEQENRLAFSTFDEATAFAIGSALRERALAEKFPVVIQIAVFDRLLFYAGQFDSSRPKIDRPPVPGLPPLRTDLPVTGEDLRRAIDAVLAGDPAPQPQRPSAGCSIKWTPEMEPVWG